MAIFKSKPTVAVEELDLRPPAEVNWHKLGAKPSLAWWKNTESVWNVEGMHCTPDISTIEDNMYNLLFVCDDLLQGRKKFIQIENNCILVANCYTVNNFEFWSKDLGTETFPIPLETDKKPMFEDWADLNTSRLAQPAKIKGQLLAVRGNTIISLDKEYANTVQYERKKVHIHIPNRRIQYKEDGQTDIKMADIGMWVWMYVGIQTYWSELIDMGFRCKPVTIYRAKAMMKEPYYYFPSS